jgi:patatin-like phospholipase/acyl hydrolase
LKIPLWQLVRASTAAPVYFPPEVLQRDSTDPSKTFVFVDGGVTPHNNPAFLLYRMATEPAYRLNWKWEGGQSTDSFGRQG